MRLYEAIENIVREFGKEIVTNAKAVNIFSDYNVFEESKKFKVIENAKIRAVQVQQILKEYHSSGLSYIQMIYNSKAK